MISRRKFVALLAAVAASSKATLASLFEPKRFIPPGFVQCPVCGDYNGRTDAGNLGKDAPRPPTGEMVGVTCLCHGRPCPGCGKMLNRPISNTYYPKTNHVEHVPYFAGWFSCGECERKKREAWDNMPKLEKERIIAEQDREMEEAGFKEVSPGHWVGPAPTSSAKVRKPKRKPKP
jgi:hypothetical protein